MRLKTGTRLALLVFCLAQAVAAQAGEIYVIAHPSVRLSETELKDVYLGEKQFAGSIKLVPVDNVAAQGDFLEKILRMETKRYAAWWIKKGFRDGLAAPLVKSNDTDVAQFVKSTPGAIGYVNKPVQGVKQLYPAD